VRKTLLPAFFEAYRARERAKTYLLDICDKLFTHTSSAHAPVQLANWQKITLLLAAETETSLNNQLTSTLHRGLNYVVSNHQYELETK
jgi:hypothetical protein